MNREYKSDVFSMLLEDKKNALEVYNALNNTDYKDPEAVEFAIEDCIREHILEEFFRERKDEVKKMTHLDYTWEAREKMIRKEEYEMGVEFGMERGMQQGIEQNAMQVYQNCLARGMSKEDAIAISGVNPAGILQVQ